MDYEARVATDEEMKRLDEEFEKDNRYLLLKGYADDKPTLTQLESFQTIGFNMKQLLDRTNTTRFEISLATQEEINYFEGLDDPDWEHQQEELESKCSRLKEYQREIYGDEADE